MEKACGDNIRIVPGARIMFRAMASIVLQKGRYWYDRIFGLAYIFLYVVLTTKRRRRAHG
jgi:hypothetical protein